jgi:hypothetical protein
MLPDRWTGDLSLVWNEVDAAWGNPEREEAILRWLKGRTPGDWARLDEGHRGWRYSHGGAPAGARGTLADGWRSFAADGYERERAVLALERDSHDVAVGFLLVRCDDWVAPVRLRARTAVLARAAAGQIDLAAWMPLLLARDARARAGGLVEACVALSPPGLAENLLHHRDRRTRRWALERVLDRAPDADELQRLVASIEDAAIARVLATRLAGLVDDAGLQRILADRRVGVRRTGWEQVVHGRLPDQDLRTGLLDVAPTIRALAQQAARARGVDGATVYLNAPQRTAAERRRRLVGLGEWGAKEAVSVARAAIDDPDESVRVSAIEVLSLRLDHPDALLLDLLRARRGAELRAVRRGLLLNHVRVGDDALAEMRRGDAEQRMAAWRLGMARGRWERLLADLLALGDDDDRLAAAVEADLGNWRVYVMPEAGNPPSALRPPLEEALADAECRGHKRTLVAWLLRA